LIKNCFIRKPTSTPYPFVRPLPTSNRPNAKSSAETVTHFPFVEDDLNVVVVDGIPTSMHDLTQTPKVRGKREENG
jgi:hypothetical protein